MKKYHIYGIGNALVDVEVLVDETFFSRMQIEKGVMSLVERPRQSRILDELKTYHTTKCCGGSAANTVIGMAQLGARTFYSCKVSSDKWGEFYTRDLVGHGVGTNLLEARAVGTTGTCVVMVTPDADRTMNTHLGISSEFSVKELVPHEISQSEWFYIEGYIITAAPGLEAALAGASVARHSGAKIALTLSDKNAVMQHRDAFMKVINGGVDAIFCNQDEALAFAQTTDINQCVEFFSKHSRCFAITLGSKGALVYDGNSAQRIYTEPVDAVDTLGAGDLFAGCFLYAITHRYNYIKAGNFACKVASILCSQYGTRLATEKLLELKRTLLN